MLLLNFLVYSVDTYVKLLWLYVFFFIFVIHFFFLQMLPSLQLVSLVLRQLKKIVITVGCTILIPGGEYCLFTALGILLR